MNFVSFIENNDNEGESWRFWLQYDGNKKAIDNLFTLFNTFDDDWMEESYTLDLTPVPEEEVDILVKHTDDGYMPYENKVVGKLDFPEPEDSESFNDMLYKGGIQDYFKKG